MYKGYQVKEIILNDYIHPETAVVVDAPAGCSQCQEMQQVQPDHHLCALIPEDLLDDDNVSPQLEGRAWRLIFTGDNSYVDEWLEIA